MKPLCIAAAALFSAQSAFGGCLEEAPKPSAEIHEKCLKFGQFGMYRGAAPYLPYEKAEDGLEKEHQPPRGPRTFLLDFTKKNTGMLSDLMHTELAPLCAGFYEGERYDMKDGKQKMAYHLRAHKAKPFEKVLLKQVFQEKEKLTVAEIASASEKYADLATKLGDEIFKDQLIPHAGSLEPGYRADYLKKMKATLASLNQGALDYHPSDCDYLNAPINHLYGLVQLSKLAAEMAQRACPAEAGKLGLEARQKKLKSMIEKDWKASVEKAVMGRETRDGGGGHDSAEPQQDAGEGAAGSAR